MSLYLYEHENFVRTYSGNLEDVMGLMEIIREKEQNSLNVKLDVLKNCKRIKKATEYYSFSETCDYQTLKINDYFTLLVNRWAILDFDEERNVIPLNKEGNLYLLTIPKNITRSPLVYVPEEIMEAISNFNLNPYLEKAKRDLDNFIEKIKKQNHLQLVWKNPNL
ncbi:MAG: hypothetical protein AABX28_01725 [Nanoarchaeota archaeon]